MEIVVYVQMLACIDLGNIVVSFFRGSLRIQN